MTLIKSIQKRDYEVELMQDEELYSVMWRKAGNRAGKVSYFDLRHALSTFDDVITQLEGR
jgi:hypothetical protein